MRVTLDACFQIAEPVAVDNMRRDSMADLGTTSLPIDADWPLLCGWAASAALALLYLLPMPSALRRWLDPIARMGKVDPSGPQAGSEKRRSADTWWSRLSVPRWFFDTFYGACVTEAVDGPPDE